MSKLDEAANRILDPNRKVAWPDAPARDGSQTLLERTLSDRRTPEADKAILRAKANEREDAIARGADPKNPGTSHALVEAWLGILAKGDPTAEFDAEGRLVAGGSYIDTLARWHGGGKVMEDERLAIEDLGVVRDELKLYRECLAPGASPALRDSVPEDMRGGVNARAAKPETKGSLFAAAMDDCTVVFTKRGAIKHLAAALLGEFPESDVLLVVPKEAAHDFTAVRLRPNGRVDIHMRKDGNVLSWLPDTAPKNPLAPDFTKTTAVVRTLADGAEATRKRDADSLERALSSVRRAFLSAQSQEGTGVSAATGKTEAAAR
jgi:hypothetical protein